MVYNLPYWIASYCAQIENSIQKLVFTLRLSTVSKSTLALSLLFLDVKATQTLSIPRYVLLVETEQK